MALSRNPVSPSIGIGHNQGPSLHGGSWTGYCWRRARREVWDNPPIEVVRIRQRRARELGLTYRQYAGILLDRGVRTEALVFDLSNLPRAAQTDPLARMAAKLRSLRNCRILAALGGSGDAERLMSEFNVQCGGLITDWARYPDSGTTDRLLQPILDLLNRHTVPPSAAIMIGDGFRARCIAETARLARVFPKAAYFT